MGLEDEYEQHNNRSWVGGDVIVASLIGEENRNMDRHHKQVDHDFCMQRWGWCHYCARGSMVMSREEIVKELVDDKRRR